MHLINLTISSLQSPVIPSHSLHLSPQLIDDTMFPLDNGTSLLLPFSYPWIFPLFLFCSFGILFTTILLFFFLYVSFRRFNNHLILPNLFLSFSVCFMYLILILFLIRGNELFCGLREFLSQLAYALLFSAFLCRYIMQWLTTRILSKRTKQLLSLLIYFLLISVQIPIGVLWWYFTIPRACQSQALREYPPLRFELRREVFAATVRPCSYQCTVDYRFYGTYTYIIIELLLCTSIGIGLFLHRYCQRPAKAAAAQLMNTDNHHTLLTFLNMFTLILIDIVWLIWTFVYYFTDPFFVFPSLVIGMFTIGTICLLLILVPQIYLYSKSHDNEFYLPKTILIKNNAPVRPPIRNPGIVLQRKCSPNCYENNTGQTTVANRSESSSYEVAPSGTYLPITRTPRRPFIGQRQDNQAMIDKLDRLIYGESSGQHESSHDQGQSSRNEIKVNASKAYRIGQDVQQQQLFPPIAPLQCQVRHLHALIIHSLALCPSLGFIQ